MEVKTILGKQELSKTDLVALLDCRDTTEAELFRHSRQLRDATIGNGVHMRGLIEISNVCIKDCLYCGIRKSNSQAQRYELWLDFALAGHLDTEHKLSRLCAWVLQADKLGVDYGLRLPGQEIKPASGEAHKRRCLEALALC